MERRQFLTHLAGGAATSSLLAQGANEADASPAPPPGFDFFKSLVTANDGAVIRLLERQEQSRGHRWFGGAKDDFAIHSATATAGLVKTFVAAYASPESAHFHSSEILTRLDQACSYLLAAQHPDGTIDLQTTNFHSPPDTGFLVEVLCPALAVLNGLDRTGLQPIRDKLQEFILKAGEALTVGGIHTPNHRWVVCAHSRAFPE